MLLKDMVVIVSGIGPGLGVKLAVEAAREGARGVVLAARSAVKLDDAETRIRALGVKCRAIKVPTDITDAAQRTRLVETTVAEFGRIDALVNSAFAHGDFAPVDHLGEDSWDQALQTNLLGSVRLTLAAVPQMKKQGGGAVVMINTLAKLPAVPWRGRLCGVEGRVARGNQVPPGGAWTFQHPREHRPHELDVGRAGSGLRADDGGLTRRAAQDGHRLNLRKHSAAQDRDRRRVRPGGLDACVRLRLGRDRCDARCERR